MIEVKLDEDITLEELAKMIGGGIKNLIEKGVKPVKVQGNGVLGDKECDYELTIKFKQK